jgi:hypothetical protein
MKKLLVISLVGILSLSSFVLKEKDRKIVRVARWNVYCGGHYATSFTCDCTQDQANTAARMICDTY